MKVVVLVPRRLDHGHRDLLWNYCSLQWNAYSIYEGFHSDGPFNRSAAINAASDLANQWDIAIIIDADVLVDMKAVEDAIYLASLGKFVVAHDRRVLLSEKDTFKVLGGQDPSFINADYHLSSTSGSVVVSRDLWDKTGGFDEGFSGYGFEDLAFQYTCETLTEEPMTRIGSDLIHLWHEVSLESFSDNPNYISNGKRLDLYGARYMNRNKMEKLIKDINL